MGGAGTFGVLCPQAYSGTRKTGSEAWTMQTQCLMDGSSMTGLELRDNRSGLHADVSRDLRRAVARDQRERIERHRRVAGIGDLVLEGEEVTVVDGNGAAEGEAFAIVIFQHDGEEGVSEPMFSCCQTVFWSGRRAVEPAAGTQPNSA